MESVHHSSVHHNTDHEGSIFEYSVRNLSLVQAKEGKTASERSVKRRKRTSQVFFMSAFSNSLYGDNFVTIVASIGGGNNFTILIILL